MTPVITGQRLAVIMAPLLAVCVAAVAYGEQAAGIFAAAVTLILWSAILKLATPHVPPSTPAPRPPRPAFVGEPNPPALGAPRGARAERVARVAADPRAPEGERAAARAALRRLES